MPKPFINFVSRAEFAKLKLKEKDAYLQDITQRYMEKKGDDFVPLTKEALSRLRRFYARRSFADLQLEKMKDDQMRASLARMGEAITGKALSAALEAEILPSAASERLTRDPPIDDAQLMFFVPNVVDAPLKDDMNLMDVAPFSLSKSRRDGVLRYELKDSTVIIEGGAEVGLANAYDYDIFLNMVSYLAEEMRRYRAASKKGQNPSLPSTMYRPTASQILKFCRREQGGKQYVELEKALDRLQATRIKIVNTDAGKRRENESFPLIGRYKVISRTAADSIDQIEIDIPTWIYDGVVDPSGRPSILTLSPDYFLIAKPTARFIYRLARKAAGQTDAYYSVKDLHYRSGSTLPLSKFIRSVEEIVASTLSTPLPDYDLELKPGRGRNGPTLYMKRREKDLPVGGQSELGLEETL